MSLTAVLAALVCAFAVGIAGCERDDRGESIQGVEMGSGHERAGGGRAGSVSSIREYKIVAQGAGRPFVALRRYPGMPVGDELGIAGLEVAVWRNGRIIRTASEKEIGHRYHKGSVSSDDVDELVAYLEVNGESLDKWSGRDRVPFEAPSSRLCVRFQQGTVTRFWWSPPEKDDPLEQLVRRLREYAIEEAVILEEDVQIPEDWFE
jgi:hypothetical protein